MVANAENITKAAEMLHVTQPTLSRQLAQLEDKLRVKLFASGKHGIALMEDGLLLRRRAVEIVALAVIQKVLAWLPIEKSIPAFII